MKLINSLLKQMSETGDTSRGAPQPGSPPWVDLPRKILTGFVRGEGLTSGRTLKSKAFSNEIL
jgi:hypothetical protein